MPTDGDVYVLDTDAREQSIGTVLFEKQGGEEEVIAYASRTYSRAEQNYCKTRKELLEVVYFLKQFRQYLLGNRILVPTDHAALTWVQRAAYLMGQQGRWQERLQKFDFDIEHRLGHKHGNADELSRRPCGWPERCQIPIVIIRPEVQQIVEVLGELNGAGARSDSTDCEEDSERGADIEDLQMYGDRAASQGHITSAIVVQVGGVSSKVAEGASSMVDEGATSKMAESVSRKVAEDVTSIVLRERPAVWLAVFPARWLRMLPTRWMRVCPARWLRMCPAR